MRLAFFSLLLEQTKTNDWHELTLMLLQIHSMRFYFVVYFKEGLDSFVVGCWWVSFLSPLLLLTLDMKISNIPCSIF